MGILEWFKNRTGHFEADKTSDEMVQWAADKAITLTNPQLKLLPDRYKRLSPAVETLIKFLRAQVALLPAVHFLAEANWSLDPVLKAFFVAPTDIPKLLANSSSLRTLFEENPVMDEAFFVLGMAIGERQGFGMALQGETVQRDVAQTSFSFSDHKTRICGVDEMQLRRAIGNELFEYLVGQALAEIGDDRTERQELLRDSALMRTRLRLLRQHGPGLGSMLGADPAAQHEQAKLDAELLENERQLEALGTNASILEKELNTLVDVLGNPGRYLKFIPMRLRLDSMNVVVADNSTSAADIAFTVIELNGNLSMRRAFIQARISRSELPPPKRMDFENAARYL